MAKTYQRTKLQEVTIRGYKSIAYDRPVTLKLGDVSILPTATPWIFMAFHWPMPLPTG